MKVKTWVPLVLAVILGLMAAKLTRDSIARGRAPKAQVSLSTLVTAAGDVEPGQVLTAEMLGTGKVAPDSVPAGAFTSPDELAGRVALTRLVKGQPVLESMLAPQGTAAGVQALIPPGMRAITLQITEFSGLGGLLAPGCRVDIISVVKAGEGTEQAVARTIVQNVEVRAVGRQISPTAPAEGPATPEGTPVPFPTNVTLLVTPSQAEAVQMAEQNGRPWLVLRNGQDTAPIESPGTSLADLRGPRKPTAPEPKPEITPEPVPVPDPVVVEAPEPEVDVDPFEETPAAPEAPPEPRTRVVKFIRGTKEEAMDVDAPAEESPDVAATETVTQTDDGNLTGGE